MPKVFRENPPTELIADFLRCVNLRSTSDTTAFSKLSVDVKRMEQILPELEPYYLPCKAAEYIHAPLTPARGIVIIRQLLKSAGIQLQSQERSTNSVKDTWYLIEKTSVLSGPVVMDFN